MSVSFAFTTKTKPPSFLQKTVKCSSVAQDDGVGGTLEGQGHLQKGANQLASRETATICLAPAFGIKRYPHCSNVGTNDHKNMSFSDFR